MYTTILQVTYFVCKEKGQRIIRWFAELDIGNKLKVSLDICIRSFLFTSTYGDLPGLQIMAYTCERLYSSFSRLNKI